MGDGACTVAPSFTLRVEVVPFFGATRELAPLMRPLQTLPASDSLVMSDGAVCCSS